ncbi:hypothetical protein BLNAU_3112 [Blattamonas nauphoetae]|uniref:Uncharacterized protein n=1 Tax=Blattamonas nauphoetae TaxID=2049346 RepID=A0ABQ9YE39_9EUKA|nr:hypothetical protein BLNAU_3112 [Blattamonas nauphoetae]
MPPKHKIVRKQNRTQPNTQIPRAQSSKSDKHVVHSTKRNSVQNDNDSSLDPHSTPCITDVVTITDNDRHYVRVSKQILQNELERQRMKAESMMEQVHLEGDEITLPTSTTSDWRLVLQDSITNYDLKQGCISLFEQSNSRKKLTPIEVFHAVHFMGYATIHIEHRGYPHNKLIETIFHTEKICRKQPTSTFLKLIWHPSDKLRAVALSFLATSLRSSSDQFFIAVAAAGLLQKLFERLKPHEIPLNETTIEFHRHFTSISGRCFFDLTPERISRHLKIEPSYSRPETLVSEIIDAIFQKFCQYLRYLVNHPISPTDYYSGLSLVSKMGIFDQHITRGENKFTTEDLQHFFVELRTNMTKELVSSLDLAVTSEKLSQLLFGKERHTSYSSWVQIFENILVRLSEGRQCSNLGLQAFLCFLSRRPNDFKLSISSDGTFSIKGYRTLFYWMHLSSNPFCTLFNTAQLHNSVAILNKYHLLTDLIDFESLVKHIWTDLFSTLFHVIAPSKWPFTSDFLPLHKQLVSLMSRCLITLTSFDFTSEHGQVQIEPCSVYNTFIDQTKEYIVHLSLHPFSLILRNCDNAILDFLIDLYRRSFENSMTKPFRENLRKDMDEAALSSSSPPFILTSELVCHLTDEEIMNVVDRIVALIESDSPISDDTILRICAFHEMKLRFLYLPEIFRKAGRSTEQCFHTFECLLSLPVDYLDLRPINSLLTPRPHSCQPTLDEWDDVDLSTVGIVMRKMDKCKIPIPSYSNRLEKIFRNFVIRSVRQVCHRAVRQNQPQLEQLLAPSIDFLGNFLVEPYGYDFREKEGECHRIIDICELGDQRVIAQCFSRIGFFSRIVSGVLDARTSFDCEYVVHVFLLRPHSPNDSGAERKMLRRPIQHFLEEGWQDVLELIFVQKNVRSLLNARHNQYVEMMGFHGANLNTPISWYYTN